MKNRTVVSLGGLLARAVSGNAILGGLLLGVATGLFVGELAAPLRFVADAFVRLLQMTVLPYVMVSMIMGIGSLEPPVARRLFWRVGALTLVLWSMALAAVFTMPLVFPALKSASFFSTTLLDTPAPVDFLSLYIPSNPFQALANNLLPAVVLFSSLIGVALMGVQRKAALLEVLSVVEQTLTRANGFVMRLTPVGLFAIAAHAAGVMDLEQAARLRVYEIAYATTALLLALVVFPRLLACLAPVSARRMLWMTREVMITAFVVGDIFVVLPLLIGRTKALLEETKELDAQDVATPDAIVPFFFNLPQAAKILPLSFVLFAAWFTETTISLGYYVGLSAAGMASIFGSVNVAIPFLLDLVHVPADTFPLFLATGVLNSRFGALAGVSHMIVISIAGAFALAGRLRLSAPRLLRCALSILVLSAATYGALAVCLHAFGSGSYEGGKMADELGLLYPASAGSRVLAEMPPAVQADGRSLLQTVRDRGRLRVGFIPQQRPYSHVNARGQLVGFDVEMAHDLGRVLGVPVDFVQVPRENLAEVLNGDRVDLVMSGYVVTAQRSSQMVFSETYLDETLAFIVPDYRRADFSDAGWVREQRGLRLAVPGLPFFHVVVRREFPNATIVPMPLGAAADPLASGLEVDAIVYTAERGSFLTLLHPAFSVVVPHPLDIRVTLAYPVARHDVEAARFISSWIEIKRKDGTIKALFDHWILGSDTKVKKRRWSVLGDVLGWNR